MYVIIEKSRFPYYTPQNSLNKMMKNVAQSTNVPNIKSLSENGVVSGIMPKTSKI